VYFDTNPGSKNASFLLPILQPCAYLFLVRRLPHIFILAAFLFSSGGQWYFLQGVAWVEMVRNFNQFYPLTQSVEMTLSGQFPCPLCKAIAQKKQDDNLKMVSGDKFKKAILCASFFLPLPPTESRSDLVDFRPPSSDLTDLTIAPPTPPPRLA
jgi:hypothetical protein